MTVFCTYCSAHKDQRPELLPALERYLSSRIRRVASMASDAATPFLIFSGQFGFLDPQHPIPIYDHLLQPHEVDSLAEVAAAQLKDKRVDAIRYFTDPLDSPTLIPYADAVRKAADLAGARFELLVLGERQGAMSDWRAITAKAEQARRALVADRAVGAEMFNDLLRQFPGDGMVYLKRGEAYEAVGECAAAADDFRKALALLPMAAWKATAREGLQRVSAGAATEKRFSAVAALLTGLPHQVQQAWRAALNAEGASAVGLYRTAVELLIEHVLTSRGVTTPPRTPLVDLIRLLQENRLVLDSTVTHLHTIRTLGNAALHGQSVGEDEAEACRIAGHAILKALAAAL